MTIEVVAHPSVRRLIGDLAHEFDGVVPVVEIRAEVLAAVGDLDGQIVPEAMEEMAHRLVSFRLKARAHEDTPAGEGMARGT